MAWSARRMSTLLSGGTVVVPTKFNALSFWRTVAEHRVTWYSAVPTMHQLLLARSRGKPTEAATLRFIALVQCAVVGGDDSARSKEFLGCLLLEAYGMTEASHQMTSNPLPPQHRKPGSVGVGTGCVSASWIKMASTWRMGTRGEIAIQGANVFRGYENNPEANAQGLYEWLVPHRRSRLPRCGWLPAPDGTDQRHHQSRRREDRSA